MMHAKERLYLTAGRDRLVREGDKAAAFLYAAKGDEIPDSAAARFGLKDGRLGKASSVETLLGSSVLPAMVDIAPGKSVQLGNVVARAHKASGLSVDEWNALTAEDREARLAETVEAWKTEAAAPKPAKAPRARKASAPKASGKEQKPAEDKERKPAQDKGGNKGADGEQPPA